MARSAATARGMSRGIAEVFINAATCVMLLVGAVDVLDGRLTTGGFSTFVLFASKVTSDLEDVFMLYSSLQSAVGAIDRCWAIVDRQPQVGQPKRKKEKGGKKEKKKKKKKKKRKWC